MFDSKPHFEGPRGLILLALGFLLVLLLVAPASAAHKIEIEVLGKSSTVRNISPTLGESFFTLFRGTSARLGDELAYQLEQIDESGFRLRRLHGVQVEPNLYFSLEGSSSSSFALAVSGFPFNASAEFRCPVSGCHYVDVYLELDEIEASGTYDYFDGYASLTVVPPDPEIDLNANLNWITGLLAGWLFDIGEAVVETVAENAVSNALQVVSVEGQLLGLTEILESLPSSVISQLGVDPLELLQNPFVGLSIDISLIAPKSFTVPGRIVMKIHHRRPSNLSGTVVTSIGTSKKPKISWSSVPGATQYKIYSREDFGSWTYRATTGSTQWSDNSVSHPELKSYFQGGRSFDYRVVAVNAHGIVSEPSPSRHFGLPPEGGGDGDDDGDDTIGIAY